MIDVQENINLAQYSTIKVGGNAQYFLIARTRDELIEAWHWAHDKGVPFHILGWASNTLISDKGVAGLVVINRSKEIVISGHVEESSSVAEYENDEDNAKLKPRLNQDLENSKEYYNFADLDYDESDQPKVEVVFDSGVPWQLAINYSISQGVCGLQFFSGIPGTVGGATFNNMHGGSHFVSEFAAEVEIITDGGELKWLPKDELEFGYDYSRFHHSKEVILRVKFSLNRGDKARAQFTAIEWAKRKKIQPARSLGCTWQNISEELKEQLQFDGVGQGYVNDQKLHLKGFKIGSAKISEAHAAFIETEPEAKAADVYQLIKHVEKLCQEQFNYTPKPEIFFLGEF